MENYGFKLLSREEANVIGLPNGSGLFGELFSRMTNDIKRKKNGAVDFGEAANMNSYEKKISFLNRYFVFKKIRKVNAESVASSILENVDEEEDVAVTQPKQVSEAEDMIEIKVKPKTSSKKEKTDKPKKPIKLNKKIVLAASSEESDKGNNNNLTIEEVEKPFEELVIEPIVEEIKIKVKKPRAPRKTKEPEPEPEPELEPELKEEKEETKIKRAPKKTKEGPEKKPKNKSKKVKLVVEGDEE
jgi:hypothetical protein